MVFFTSILIVVILYYLQSDGFIYVIIIALVAELINIFMTHTVTKSAEKRLATQHRRVLDGYKKRQTSDRKTIKEFERIQEDSVTKLYNANMKIKKYEEELAGYKPPAGAEEPGETDKPTPLEDPQLESPPEQTLPKKEYIDLPDGSNRK